MNLIVRRTMAFQRNARERKRDKKRLLLSALQKKNKKNRGNELRGGGEGRFNRRLTGSVEAVISKQSAHTQHVRNPGSVP